MNLSVKKIIFEAVNQVVTTEESESFDLEEQDVLLETSYSCISAGTELAKLSGLQKVSYPICLGNRAVGRVLKTGATVTHVKPGDLVFSHTAHRSHSLASKLVVKLPEELDHPAAAMLGMAMVALVGVQTALGQLGDTAVITGGGLVGQFAAQLLELSGVRTILVDPVPGRLEIARQCGISHVIPAGVQTREEIMDLTQGQGAELILECTGIPAVLEESTQYAATSGTIVMIGSPRGQRDADFVTFLNKFHLWQPQGNLTLKGAHEWKVPLYGDGFHKHSMERNAEILTRLSTSGQLKLSPLLSKVYRPDDAASAYLDLHEGKDRILGAVFDWTKG